MGIRESLLNTITSVADSDFVRIVTSAGASSKATVRNLFKGFESNLSAKSSLTTSDYIRVVGSDNEAYKQSVSAVKTAMGIDALSNDYIVEQGTSGIWTYRKWNSGIAECWGWYTFAVSTWSAWGSVYESNRGETTYPSGLFTGTYPICNVTYQSGSLGTAAMSIELSGGSATATPTFWIVRPSAGGTGNALIGLRAIGRWK